jgi:hypothetical protein
MMLISVGESGICWYSHSTAASSVDVGKPQSHFGVFVSMPPFPTAA